MKLVVALPEIVPMLAVALAWYVPTESVLLGISAMMATISRRTELLQGLTRPLGAVVISKPVGNDSAFFGDFRRA